MLHRASSITFFYCVCWKSSLAFTVPTPLSLLHTTNWPVASASGPLAFDDLTTQKAMASSVMLADGTMDGVLEIVKNIAIVITAVLFLLAGLTQLMGSIVLPAAAKELEKECMELAPEWWDEYQAKLEPGQTMATRPDLIQELGTKLQPLLDAKIAEFESGQASPPSSSSTTGNTVVNDDNDTWMSPQLDLSAITDQIPTPGQETTSSTSSPDDMIIDVDAAENKSSDPK